MAHRVARQTWLFTEANADSPEAQRLARRVRRARHRLVIAMAQRNGGNESAAVALLEWLQATHQAQSGCGAEGSLLPVKTTTARPDASRDPWDPGSVVTGNSGGSGCSPRPKPNSTINWAHGLKSD